MLSQSLQTLLTEINEHHQKLVCVFGNFNILHPGHIRFLKFAAEQGDKLVIGLLAKDYSSGAFLSDNDRAEALKCVTVVDDVFMVTDNKLDFIDALQPSAVVKGKEFEKLDNDEQDAVNAYGGQLVFGSGEFISANALDSAESLPYSQLNFSYKSLAYCNRHQIHAELLKEIIAHFTQLKVAVIGDVIVDEYIDCHPIGMSQEDPTIVVSPQKTRRFIGGAGIVAAHAQGLGASVDFYSVVGEDDNANYVEQQLTGFGVKSTLIKDPSRPTTTKTRYRANGKSLLRVNNFRQHDIHLPVRQQLLDVIIPKLKNYDLIIFSDFNYGFLCNGFLESLICCAKENNVAMVADSQSSSQVGDLAKFHDMLLITPTEHEARLTLQNSKDGLIQVSEKVGEFLNAKHVMVTLAEDGVLIRSKNKQAGWWDTDELPTFNKSPLDVAGAGDAMLTASAMSLVSKADIWQASFIGSLAAGCQVGRVGNVPLQYQELLNAFSQVNAQ
ncbi:hypothetical protein A9Q74_14160 [Colwellia sp. 39_35_sub15_T18]|nr:hypothetical protein A9Q74_14160 [Colwellia sp. 39_35_sub15_T18]